MKARLLRALVLAFFVLGATMRAQETHSSGCRACHEPEGKAHDAGTHQGNLSCTDCHGGVASGKTLEESHSGDYRGVIPRTDVPLLCGTCHADVARMSVAGLPSGALREYAASGHGHTVMVKGDQRSAICTDCHTVHEARSASDPLSPMHGTNQAKACGSCHSDSELMGAYDLPATACDLYLNDAHGRALTRGDASAPSCTSCHGAHATLRTLPTRAGTCGRCHEEEFESLKASPHSPDAAKGLSCYVCHASHGLARAGPETMSALCSECHEADSPEGQAAEGLRSALVEIEILAVTCRRELEIAAHDPPSAARAEILKRELTETASRARAVAHTLDIDSLEKTRDRLLVMGKEAEELSGRRGRLGRTRRLLAVPAGIAFAAIIAALLTIRGFVVARRGLKRGSEKSA